MSTSAPKDAKVLTKEPAHKVITVQSKPDFDKLITESVNKHILVEFYATWCGPCRIISPRLEELAKEYADKLLIVKIDVDNLEELALEYDITSMPTFMIFKNKVKLEQFVGSNSEKVESTLQKFCGKPNENGNEKTLPIVPPQPANLPTDREATSAPESSKAVKEKKK